ncbi:MAG: TetR/AcrR family transcriptional regulator, partial [Lewinella sp.]|nr:TetR/AcrR family transcriptional regulator [Lewinella sp.]
MPRHCNFEKDKVIEQAQAVFWKHGFAATSIQQLEEATGLKRSSLYHAFGNKEDLYKQTLLRYQNAAQRKLTDCFKLAAEAGPLSGLRCLFEQSLTHALQDPEGRG